MPTNLFPHRRALRLAAALALPTLLAACSMMTDDRADCPSCNNPLRVTLRYDYNTQRADMFSDHAEEATVYVVDPATGTVVDRQTARNSGADQPLRQRSFAFNFSELPFGQYRLYATARSAATPSALSRALSASQPAVGDAIGQLAFRLPAGDQPAERLDTLWNTLQPVDVSQEPYKTTEATVPLMRLTNDLNVIISRADTPTDNSHSRYDVTVSAVDAELDYQNQPSGEPTAVVYHPFAEWTTEGVADDVLAEQTAHYDLSLSRLVYHQDDARQNPRLRIVNRADGKTVADIDLCYYLARARNAYETENYGIQEYLDREYDYRLSFELEGDTWKYMSISIGVLTWTLRIQNVSL